MKKIIKDYPNYEIHSHGEVYSLPRKVEMPRGGFRKQKGKFMKQGTSTNGYKQVQLCNDGGCKLFFIHQLVAIAFLGHTPNGHDLVVHHKNDRKFPNDVDNLELIPTGKNVSLGFKSKGATSKYRGVSYNAARGKWKASVGKSYYGLHLTEEDAYNAVKHLH